MNRNFCSTCGAQRGLCVHTHPVSSFGDEIVTGGFRLFLLLIGLGIVGVLAVARFYA